MNRTKKQIAVFPWLCVLLSGCVELSYIRPVVSDSKPAISIPAAEEIRHIALSNEDPIAGLIEAKYLPQFQVAQYACQYARRLPDQVNVRWYLLCAQTIVDLTRNQREVLHGGQALQELYNEASSRIFAFVKDQPKTVGEVLYEDQNFVIPNSNDNGQVQDFTELLVSSNYKLSQFDDRYAREGFGIPLIGFKDNRLSSPVDALYPPEGRSYAYTGIVDFKPKTMHGKYVIELQLLDPGHISYVNFGRCEYPLAADFSAPYAYLLSRSSLKQLAWSGFFAFEKTEDHLGLFLMQSYDPKKIPIVMIHGLLSSPREWAQLTNTIFGSSLADRYQVWHYVYPTAAPFLYSAYILKQKLEQARLLLDPELDDTATNNIIFVAHSMGGLLTKSLAMNSGSQLWDAAFTTDINTLHLLPADREALRSIFFLTSKSYVKRIVFLGTPHRGSEFADSLIGYLGSTLTRRPAAMKSLLKRVTTDNPYCLTDAMKSVLVRGGPTSVRGLSPEHPLTRVFASIPLPSDIPFHTIIGSGSRNKDGEIGDGIVTYASAHLEGAASESILPVRHTKYDDPIVIDAIVDILQLHLDTIARVPDKDRFRNR